jgi:hypothetical protein
MKKLVLFSLIALCTFTYGQKLNVTPNGLRDANDNEKTYVVINCEGKTAQELYNNAIKYINKKYKNPDEVIKSKIEGEYLRFNTYKPTFLLLKNSGVNILFKANYTTELSFKDGRVKYEITELNIINDSNFSLVFTGSGIQWFIYNKNGELKRADAKTQIEDYFKGEILTISQSLNTVKVVDKW